MKSPIQKTLDDILFEERNKEYGSYRLRKQYVLRLAISFLISLFLIVSLTLCYSWFLNSAGDVTVYLYPSSGLYLKSTHGSIMDPEELKAYLNNPAPALEQQKDFQNKQKVDALHNFEVAEKAATDTFTPAAEEVDSSVNSGMGLGSSTDSTVFGGFLLGNGEGVGSGSNLDLFPLFPGGLEAVRRYIEFNVQYPTQAIKQKIHGVVLISFDVNKLGEVDNVKVERSINPMLDAEAIKTIKDMPRWKPGMRHGKPVIVKFVIPVNFMPVS
jgi:TonB family protein